MPVDREELEAIVEALIEEARQRARRRRQRRGAFITLAVLVGCGLYFGLDRGGDGTAAAPVARAPSGGATAARSRGRWSVVGGPDGGSVSALAVAPSAPQEVYAGSGRGVFRSRNGGLSWTSVGPLPSSGSQSWFHGATSLVVAPRSPATVYAGRNSRWAGGMSYAQAAVKSTNGGRSWRSLGLHGQPIAISPTGPPFVYAVTGGPRKTTRLVRSRDGGRSWEPADGGLPSTYIWALAFDPAAPATMYAALGGRGIFESSDRGGHWRTANIPVRYGAVTAIAIDPMHPRTIFAATNAGIAVSRNGGRGWRMLTATIREHGPLHWYMQVSALLVDPRDSRTVYASTRCAGVFRSTDGGRSWSSANQGLMPGCPWAYSLALDPQAPRIMYAADPTRGVFKSVDGGVSWQMKVDGLRQAAVSAVAVDPHQPTTVYAATGALGLFKSRDGGVHWRPLATGLEGVYSVAIDPGDPSNVIAAGSTPPGTTPSAAHPLAVSTDAGGSWKTADFGGRWVSAVAINGQSAYAGSAAGWGVFGSSDAGRNWRALGPPGVVYVQALAVDPQDPLVVYAGAYGKATHRGLYKSTDGGSSWLHVVDDVDVPAIALDPEDPATLYIAANGTPGGVLKSTDGGATWHSASTGLPTLRVRTDNPHKKIMEIYGVSVLEIDPARPATLYATVSEHGVYRSTDAGESWHPLNTGLTDRNLTALTLDATGGTLYASTGDDGGIVRLRNP